MFPVSCFSKRFVIAAALWMLAAVQAYATVTVTSSNSAATLQSVLSSAGITLVGTPTLANGGKLGTAGTFCASTTCGAASNSNLGLSSGIILSTGNLITSVPGAAPNAGNLSSNGSGVGGSCATSGAGERDITEFSFKFTPNAGVSRLSMASVFASDEYNQYSGTTFTDNFTMLVTSTDGVYNNTNIAIVPGTGNPPATAGVGTDINTVNTGFTIGGAPIANSYPAFYRDNTVNPAPIPDIRVHGATTVFYNAFDVNPAVTYTVLIHIADVFDCQFDSFAFVNTSTVVNNPPGLQLSAGIGNSVIWDEGGPAIGIVAPTAKITTASTTLGGATITLNSPVATDLLSIGTLPAGITASAYNPATGVITLSGTATVANYLSALQNILYSNTALNPTGPLKTISVVVSDGFVNSNASTVTVNIAALTITKSITTQPTIAAGATNAATDAGDTIVYSFTVTNTGTVALTAVAPVDPGPKFNGIAGTGTMTAFTPVNLAVGGSSTFSGTYTISAADITNGVGVTNGVVNTAKATGKDPNAGTATSTNATATTAITKVMTISVAKAVTAPTVAAGASATLTDQGDTVAYTFTIKNTGNIPLINVKPVDPGPKFNTVAGTGTMSAFSPTSVSLAIGATQVFTATYTLSALDVENGAGIANGVSNTATASGTDAGGTAATANSVTANTAITSFAGLLLAKTAAAPTTTHGLAPGVTYVADTITFTYTLKNPTAGALNTITITDPGPKFNGIAGTGTMGPFSTLGPYALAGNASLTVTATYTLSAADIKNGVGIANGVVNTASATGKTAANVTVNSTAVTGQTTITAVPLLAITKSANLVDGNSNGTGDLNEVINYTYVVTNKGNVPLTAVQVNDIHGTAPITAPTPVPLGPAVPVAWPNDASGIANDLVSTAGPAGFGTSTNAGTTDGIIDSLTPGSSATFTWAHKVTQAEMDHG